MGVNGWGGTSAPKVSFTASPSKPQLCAAIADFSHDFLHFLLFLLSMDYKMVRLNNFVGLPSIVTVNAQEVNFAAKLSKC